MRALLLACAATLLAPLPLRAQPEPQRFTLPNGLRVLHLEDRERPLVRALLHMSLEPADPPAGCQGLPGLLLRMLTHSATADLRPEAFHQLLEDSGIQLAAFQAPGGLNWRVTARSRDQDRAFGLLADRLQRTLFDPTMLEAQRQACLHQEEALEAHPYARLRRLLAQAPESRHAASLAITFNELLRFKARVFRPDRAVLVIHGDLGLEQAKRLVLLSLGTWTASEGALTASSPGAAPPAPPSQGSPLHIPASGLGLRIQALAPRPEAMGPEVAALLGLLVPEEPALAPLQVTVEATFLVATLDAGKQAGPEAWSLLHGRLETLRRRGFTPADLALARTAWQARRSLDALHPEAQMDAALQAALGRGLSLDRMKALSLEELNAGLRDWLDPARLRGGAAGDPDVLKTLLHAPAGREARRVKAL